MVFVSSAGRFHSFVLAKGLEQRGLLTEYFSSGLLHSDWDYIKKSQSFGQSISFNRFLSFADRFFTKFSCDRFLSKSSWYVFRDSFFDRWVLSLLQGYKKELPNVFVGWANASLESIKFCRANGIKTFIECGSKHILEQKKILQNEFLKHGLLPIYISDQNIDRMLEEYCLADKISVPSEVVAQSFINQGVAHKKLVVTPYGSDALGQTVKKKITSPAGPVQFLFAGQVSLQKGFFYLFKAWMDNFTQDHNVFLTIVGEVNPECLGFVATLEKLKNVKIVGPVAYKEMTNYYSRADVFVLPSLQEGMAMVIGEAASQGLAIICTKACGWSEFLIHNQSCLEVEESNSQALGQEMKRVVAERDLIKSLAQKAGEVAKSLSWERYLNSVCQLYSQL